MKVHDVIRDHLGFASHASTGYDYYIIKILKCIMTRLDICMSVMTR